MRPGSGTKDFSVDFVEVVWGDGTKIGRTIVSPTGRTAMSHGTFAIPFDRTGNKWARFATWDAAGNGAFAQPVHF